MVLLHSKSTKFTHDIPQGKLEDAERYLRRAVVEARAGFSTGDPHVAAALNNLAELYRCDTRLQCFRTASDSLLPRLRGEFDKAVPLYREASAMLVRTPPALHAVMS
jgi:hypothetical protein